MYVYWPSCEVSDVIGGGVQASEFSKFLVSDESLAAAKAGKVDQCTVGFVRRLTV